MAKKKLTEKEKIKRHKEWERNLKPEDKREVTQEGFENVLKLFLSPVKGKRPTDVNQRAKLIVDISTGAKKDIDPDAGKNPHAVAMGKLGASKGGNARAKKLTAKRRKEIATKASKVRWGERVVNLGKILSLLLANN